MKSDHQQRPTSWNSIYAPTTAETLSISGLETSSGGRVGEGQVEDVPYGEEVGGHVDEDESREELQPETRPLQNMHHRGEGAGGLLDRRLNREYRTGRGK